MPPSRASSLRFCAREQLAQGHDLKTELVHVCVMPTASRVARKDICLDRVLPALALRDISVVRNDGVAFGGKADIRQRISPCRYYLNAGACASDEYRMQETPEMGIRSFIRMLLGLTLPLRWMPRSSTEQPRPRLPVPCRHWYRTSGAGSRLPRRASCSRPRAHNTRSEKRTETAEETLNRSRRSTAPSSTSRRSRAGSISYAILPP
jgi:hypothetical protein